MTDEFYRGFSAHQIIEICMEANEIGEAKELFSEISDEFIREKVIDMFPELVD